MFRFSKDTLATGPVFASVLFTLISMCYYSVISVVAYTCLFILGAVVGVKIYLYVMKNFLKKPDVVDPIAKLSGCDWQIPQDKIDGLSGCVGGKLNLGLSELRRLFLVENMFESIKFGASLWFLTYIGSWFNAMTLVILAWVAVFSVPKIYLNNQAAIDPILEKVKATLDEVQSKVGGVIPGAAPAVAKKEE